MGFLFRAANIGYYFFNIVKKFAFKMLWGLSCVGFMFVLPAMFEMLSEQEAVLDKIQRDDMLQQAGDMGSYDGGS